jgi:hypothetical protein
MVAYSFQKMFAEDIRFGFKTHTVRDERKRHARPGEMLQLYTGMRTKHCRPITGERKAVAVLPITLRFEEPCRLVEVLVNGDERDPRLFAEADGFAGWAFPLPGDWFADGKGRRTNIATECMGAFWRRSRRAFIPEWSGCLIEWESPDIIASPQAYEETFGAPIVLKNYLWAARKLGWDIDDTEIDGLPADLPDLGVRA